MLRVESSYTHKQRAKFRFTPQSGYTIGLILSETYSCFRPKADVQIISEVILIFDDCDQGQVFYRFDDGRQGQIPLQRVIRGIDFPLT